MLYRLNKYFMLSLLGTFTVLAADVPVDAAGNSLKGSPLVSLYKQKTKPEKGPIRIRFIIDDSLATKVEWDESFYKRHLILREVKKGFTGYMYQFENDLLSATAECDERNAQAHVSVVLKVSDISTGYSNEDFMNFYQLKLDSSINYTVAEFPSSKTELGYIQFNEPRKGRLKLSHGAIRKLRKYGDQIADAFVQAKLQELIAHLHKGIKGSKEQVSQKMAVCQQAMDDNLDDMKSDP